MKKKWRYALLSTCGLLITATSSEAKVFPKDPNILLILVDDLGYGDLSCQQSAHDLQTPHIDKLLTDGIRFTNCYSTSPVSSPSRASLLTGRYADLVGVPGVVRPQKEDNWGYFSPEAILLPQMLKKKSYHTALIGKWHLGYEAPNVPTLRGFDYFHGFLGGMVDDYYKHTRFGLNMMRENLKVIQSEGHCTDLFTNWAIRYLTERKNKKEPFFLYLAYNAPHSPVQPPQEWLEKVKQREPAISEKRAKLVALIEHLDDNIGKVYETLEKEGLLENTLIIFASDNGGQANCAANNLPFRGAKEDMYEGGIHVAGGVYWKGHIQGGIKDNFVMLSDIFPTLCELTEVPVTHTVDGISILPLLKGEKQDTEDRMVYWVRREGNFRYGGKDYYAARYNGYKILQNTPWEPIEFYHIRTDFEEKYPIEERSSEIYKTLFKGMMEHIRQAGAVPWQKEE